MRINKLEDQVQLQYSIDNLVRLARREKNDIRPYLYVNPFQGKHIPSRPQDFMTMCHSLAGIIKSAYSKDCLYVIGFAETATGIASGICSCLDNVVFFQNTTREYREGTEYLYFTESHSHATDQMLRSSGIENCLDSVSRVLFVDDEVTTGNTISKLIDAIKKKYCTDKIEFSIVSILNSMPKERINELKQKGIDCIYLAALPFEYKKDTIEKIAYDENVNTYSRSEKTASCMSISFDARVNPRNLSVFQEYMDDNRRFSESVINRIGTEDFREILVLGTEEFMFPAIFLAQEIEKLGLADEVRVHSTTRSPILASVVKDYPLFHRYAIRSVYNNDRCTYIYNLKQYDKVIVVTDSPNAERGVSDLFEALKCVGNKNMDLYQWIYR